MPTPPHILVVEDNDFVRMQLVRFLEEGGYYVEEAIDGTQALVAIKQARPQVLVVDVRMAPMDGFELIKSLHGQGLFLPVIFVTGDHNPDLLSEAARWNVTAVLMKPVQKDRLLQMVSRALSQQNKKNIS